MIPSRYQQTLLSWCDNHVHNVIIQACAGSGKTTTLTMMVERLLTRPLTPSILVLAFNKQIAEELSRRVSGFCDVSTMHSLGMKTCMKNMSTSMNHGKQWHIVNKVVDSMNVPVPSCTDEYLYLSRLKGEIIKLGAVVMATLCDLVQLEEACIRCGLDFSPSPLHMSILPRYLTAMESHPSICYDEMIYRPIMRNYRAEKYDFVFVDEAQDLNEAQQRFLQLFLKPTSLLVAVGDRHQAIYGFRGADPKSMDTLKEMFSCVEYSLPVSYRCAQEVVRAAAELVPPDTIFPALGAPLGEVIAIRDTANADEEDPKEQLLLSIHPGDMVLCRTNAPLVRMCLKFARAGRKGFVRGRDICQNLNAVINGFGRQNMSVALDAWKRDKILKTKNWRTLEAIDDTYDTILTIMKMSDAQTPKQLSAELEKIFSDDNPAGAIMFSSIHRAKGLEADRVILIESETLPHPRATTAVAILQERNLEYVALTRARETFVYVE